jgi:hypothetical protein
LGFAHGKAINPLQKEPGELLPGSEDVLYDTVKLRQKKWN